MWQALVAVPLACTDQVFHLQVWVVRALARVAQVALVEMPSQVFTTLLHFLGACFIQPGLAETALQEPPQLAGLVEAVEPHLVPVEQVAFLQAEVATRQLALVALEVNLAAAAAGHPKAQALAMAVLVASSLSGWRAEP